MTEMERVRKGLDILLSYHGKTEQTNWMLSAEHDVVYFGGPLQHEVTEEHKAELDSYGFHWSDEYDSWYLYC